MTEAWFEPLAAHQRVIGSSFTALATANEILLDVALLHLELLANQAILEAQRLTERQGHDLAEIVNRLRRHGERRTADANRAQADWKLRELPSSGPRRPLPSRPLDWPTGSISTRRSACGPREDHWFRLNLIALDTPTLELIEYALRTAARPRRPTARRSRGPRSITTRSWHGHGSPPSGWATVPAAFGGGSNIIPPLLAHFGGRSDFDVRVFWTLMNLGAGNISSPETAATRTWVRLKPNAFA